MKMSYERICAHTRHPFHIARPGASVDGCDVNRIIVRLEHDGIVGMGEAAPAPYYGQDLDSVERTLLAAKPLLDGPPQPIEPLVDALLEKFDDQRATVAALDAALHDWQGKAKGQPVWRLLNLDRLATPPTSMTIGIDAPDLVERKVAEVADFGILKIKVGTERDQQTLEIIRRYAPSQKLRVDANCGWSPDNVMDRMAAVARFDIELIEQPLPAGSFEALAKLQADEAVDVPIIADEDCQRLGDIDRLVGLVDGVNIKLSKSGGLIEAMRMIRRAREVGLSVMLGCMAETSLGVAAAAQIASLADYVDLDGHLLLRDDPFEGLEQIGDIVRPSDAPGLGVTPRSSASQMATSLP